MPMKDKPISRFPVPELAQMPEDVRARILEVQEKSGFVPNVFLALAHRPAEFRAFFAYHDALMEKEGGLTKAEREMIVVATSGIGQGDAALGHPKVTERGPLAALCLLADGDGGHRVHTAHVLGKRKRLCDLLADELAGNSESTFGILVGGDLGHPELAVGWSPG